MCMNRKHFVAKTVECVLRRFFVLFHSYATGRDYMPAISQTYVHPCEKVKGIFFDKGYFSLIFLSFIPIFIHDLFEEVNLNYANFYWIWVIGYISVTFWKGHLDRNPMLR